MEIFNFRQLTVWSLGSANAFACARAATAAVARREAAAAEDTAAMAVHQPEHE